MKKEKKLEPKQPEEKKVHETKCEVDVEKWFTKARSDKGMCTISEYMDSISRNGANFLEMKKDVKFNEKFATPSSQ